MTNINTFQGDVFIHEYIKHTGDDNNLFGFSGTDTFKIATAGADRLTINSGGSVTVGVNMFIPDYIHHVGDSDALFGFSGTDTFKIQTAGTDRLTINSAGNVDIGVNLVIPNYIYHTGDSNTYFGFSGADTIAFYTGGVHAADIASNGTFRFYQSMYIADYIYHYSDNNTYFGFSGNDTIVMRTAGTDRLTINSAGMALFANTLGVGVSPSGVTLQVSGYTKSDYLLSDYGSFYASRLVNHSVNYLVNKTLMFLWESQNGSYPAYGMQFMWYRSGVGTGSQSIIPASGPGMTNSGGYVKYVHPGPSFSMTWRTIRWN
jgi:Ca2+-binding RTX toxin-like protein